MRKALNNQINSAEYARTIHRHVPEPGATLGEIRRSEYWANVTAKLKAGDRIEIEPESRKWYAELYVLSNRDKKVTVHLVAFANFADPEMEVEEPEKTPVADINEARERFFANKKTEEGYTEEYKIEFRKMSKWRVVRASDKEVIKSGFETEQLAAEWLEVYRNPSLAQKTA